VSKARSVPGANWSTDCAAYRRECARTAPGAPLAIALCPQRFDRPRAYNVTGRRRGDPQPRTSSCCDGEAATPDLGVIAALSTFLPQPVGSVRTIGG
jgi:hypothetical protein